MSDPDGRVIATIAVRHGISARAARTVLGRGSVNHVVVMGEAPDRHVIRMAVDPARADEFEVEEWCLRAAASHGIPSPRVVGRGRVGGRSYLVQRFVEPSQPAPDEDRTWRALADYGRTIATIGLSDAPARLFTRFGRDLDRAWAEHLAYHRHQLRSGTSWSQISSQDLVEGELAIVPRLTSGLGDVLDRLDAADLQHGLVHGDLAPQNILVGPGGLLVLLDWGCAAAGPRGFGELLPVLRSHLERGEPDVARLVMFADALGLPLAEHGPTLRDLHLLATADRLLWALERRPDLLSATLAATHRLVPDTMPWHGHDQVRPESG